MTTTQPATIKAVDPALFNAFGVYVYNHQRNILGNRRPDTLQNFMHYLISLNRDAVRNMYPNDPTKWLMLDGFDFSITRAFALEVTRHAPHFNRFNAVATLDFIRRHSGPVGKRDNVILDDIGENLLGNNYINDYVLTSISKVA